MELKPSIQDYTRDEFTTLVHTLWHGNIQQEDHDKLIDHFDSIVEHPDGADLIFHAKTSVSGISPSVDGVVYMLEWWRRQNSKPGFKGELAVAPHVWPKQTKETRSAAALAKINKIETDLNAAKLAVEQVLQSTVAPLTSIERQRTASEASPLAPAKSQQLASLIEEIGQIQTAESLIGTKMYRYSFFGDQLTSEVSQAKHHSVWIDSATHADVMQQLDQLINRFQVSFPAIDRLHKELETRIAAAMPWAEEHRIRLAAQTRQGPNDVPTTFTTSAMEASSRALFLTPTANEAAAFESSFDGLQFAMQSAIARFAWDASATTGGAAGQYTDLLKFSTRLNADERYGFCVPLAEIIPLDGHDWLGMAQASEEVDLPVRLGSGVVFSEKDSRDYKHVYLTPSDGIVVPAPVRVRSARPGPDQRTYQFTSDGVAPTTIVWTLPLTLEELRHQIPVPLDTSKHPGIIRPQSIPNLLALPTDVEFDDYVIVFPEESDIAPLYLMLKDRRHYAGVTEGQGVDISGEWLSGESTAEAKVPSRIAEQLRGRVFKQFDDLKIVFWKAIAADPAISMQFAPEEIAVMLNGAAPSVTHEGLRKTYYLSHISPAAQGGKVYDFDNMRVMLRG
ncbi:MAG: colicin immunity protein [Pseudomonas sp.]|uniref:S-type pyocin domain-containing protein n=1 Tax=Pseudomonas sp. TaxID=306 RepID=UPI002614308B|nr:S-type pyocin domain-containing protein [Pseudomonas sp.]MDB6047408.1 colicin immunity protein [Pseudomonas sp.]